MQIFRGEKTFIVLVKNRIGAELDGLEGHVSVLLGEEIYALGTFHHVTRIDRD